MSQKRMSIGSMRCPGCKRNVLINSNGTLRRHEVALKRGSDICPYSGKLVSTAG